MASQTTNCPFCSIEISSHFYANHLNYCSKIHGCSITKVSSKENSKLQTCPSCQKNFTTAEFTSHLVSCVKKKSQEKVEFQENSSIAFQCLKCSQSFASVEEMEKHNSICKAKKIEKFSDDISIISEIKSPQNGHLKPKNPYYSKKFGHCVLCIKPFIHCDHFLKGMKYINGKKRKCIKCNLDFNGIEMSIQHYKKCFEDHGPIIVDSGYSLRCHLRHCRKLFPSQKDLTLHVLTCALKCYTCNTTFPTSLLAQIHRKICKLFKNIMQKKCGSWFCTLCSDRNFHDIETAFIHVRDKHGDKKDVIILRTLGVSGFNFPNNQKPPPHTVGPCAVQNPTLQNLEMKNGQKHEKKCEEKIEFPENHSIALQCLKCSQSFTSVEKMEKHNSICKEKKMEKNSDDVCIISEIKSPQNGHPKNVPATLQQLEMKNEQPVQPEQPQQPVKPTPVLISLTKKSKKEESEAPLRRSKRARVGPKRYQNLEEKENISPSQKLTKDQKSNGNNDKENSENSVDSDKVSELTMSIDEVKHEPIDQHDDYPVMPKITSTTSLVESGIQMDELDEEVEEDNLEISTVYDCPICSKKYLTLEIAEKHIEVYHKIPTEMQYVLGLKIQATTL